jgi:hypothetical protein
VRIVRDREDARWLPSRFHFALFRLFAFARMLATRPRERPGMMLVIDRDQSEIEHYTVAIWIVLTVSCLFAVIMPFALAVVIVPFALQIPLYISGRGIRFNSILTMALIAIPAAYLATKPGWHRYAAWQFFAMIALNALAALIMLALRGKVRKMEERCGL